MSAQDDRVLYLLGQVRGETRATRQGMASIERQLEMVRAAVTQQGQAIGALPCESHKRRLSDIYRALGVVREDTDRIRLTDAQRRALQDERSKWLRWGWFGLKTLFVVLAALGIGGGLVTALLAVWR